MGTFAKDRDLLGLEPNVFRDVSWAGQQLVRGTGVIASGELTIDSVDLVARGVSVGMVAVVNGLALEITGFNGPTRARVSLLRESAADGSRVVANVTGATASVTSFGPQVAIVHRQVLRMMGIESDEATASADGLGTIVRERQITNSADLVLLESLGALHLIYSAASALLGVDSPAGQRAEMYRERFARERFRSSARIDTDGDGVADAVRRANVVMLVRG